MQPKLMLILLILGTTFMGCATSNYKVDRLRDAADIFTATSVLGIGANVRAGPVAIAPFHFIHDKAGLRGGVMFRSSKGFPIPLDQSKLEGVGLWFFSGDVFGQKNYSDWWGYEERMDLVFQRGKTFQADAHFIPFINWPAKPHKEEDQYKVYPAYYFTQIEVSVAAGKGVRIGFNPGELVDFVFGFTTLDIFNDDCGVIKEEPKQDNPPRGAQP